MAISHCGTVAQLDITAAKKAPFCQQNAKNYGKMFVFFKKNRKFAILFTLFILLLQKDDIITTNYYE